MGLTNLDAENSITQLSDNVNSTGKKSPITISTTEEAHAADIGFEEPDYNDNLDFFVDNEVSESVEAETSSALDRIMGKVSENKKKADKEKGVNQGYAKDKKRKISIIAEELKEAFAQQTRTLRYIPERGEQGTFFAESRKTNCLLKIVTAFIGDKKTEAGKLADVYPDETSKGISRDNSNNGSFRASDDSISRSTENVNSENNVILSRNAEAPKDISKPKNEETTETVHNDTNTL